MHVTVVSTSIPHISQMGMFIVDDWGVITLCGVYWWELWRKKFLV